MDKLSVHPEYVSVINAFANSTIPFAVLDSKLHVISSNDALTKRFPGIENPLVLYGLFNDVDPKTVTNYLITDKKHEFMHDLPDQKSARIVLNAVFENDSDKFIGASALVLSCKSSEFMSGNVSQCMAAVNRELRDRISMMFTSVYAISSTKSFDPCSKASEYINSINQNCYQLLRVSDNLSKLLHLSVLDDYVDPSLIDFTKYLSKLIDAVISLNNKNLVPIDFICEVPSVVVNIDIGRMEFAIVNIILNSIKYTREGNIVTIRLKTVGDYAVLTIEDKGAGIPEDILKKVGEPYFSYSHNEKFEPGFGIGLCIAKKYIASNCGLFSITSEEGVGTVVTVSIPINKAQDGESLINKMLAFNSPPRFEPLEKFSQTSIQLSEVCYYPSI